MEHRAIGPLKVTVVGIGCNNFGGRVDEAGTAAVVRAALEEGINFFDTADIYGATKSEEFLGRALAGRRDEVVIATKFGMEVDPERKGGKAAYVKRACEDSLRRLGTDRIDLYQFHLPDPETPIDETLGALDDLVREGKVLAIGNSNFSGEQIDEAEAVARAKGITRFVSAQNQYNLLQRDVEQDVLPACERQGLAFLPYFPLAHGLLTGKYVRGQEPPKGSRLAGVPAERRGGILSERSLTIVERLDAFARAHKRTLLELAISWLAAQPAVASVIAGATKPEQVKANAAAAGWALTADEIAEVARIAG